MIDKYLSLIIFIKFFGCWCEGINEKLRKNFGKLDYILMFYGM